MADGQAHHRKSKQGPDAPVARASLPATPTLASADPVTVGDAVFPKKRAPVSAATLRQSARALDVIAASLIAWYCLTLSGNTILGATIFEIIPFVLVPIVASWGLRTASAYDYAFDRTALDHMLRTANGSGLPLAAIGFITYLIYQGHGARWPILGAGFGSSQSPRYKACVRTVCSDGRSNVRVLSNGRVFERPLSGEKTKWATCAVIHR